MSKAQDLLLADARQSINRIYLDESSEAEEILESLEKLVGDIEMYSMQLEKRLTEEAGGFEDDSEG